ncbi:unnamed protein product [Nezara viridula]|uniref:TOG domain-containing protein n=1 Tax=Nezara viridula TaxID=85310 RepID=A0A9P0MPN4_NEZVI|nr:unnamed protein product [Nezara viridula]
MFRWFKKLNKNSQLKINYCIFPKRHIKICQKRIRKSKMGEKDLSTDLPPEIACIHRKWNVRSVAYRTLIGHFKKLHPSSGEWGIYKNVLPNIAAESFPALREQALEVVLQFVQKCETANKLSTEVIHSLLDNIPTNMKHRAKQLLEQVILQYVEVGCSKDVIDELLRTALINQESNIVTTCIEFITKIVSVFGPKEIDLGYVLETLPYLQETDELELRSATKALILEIYRWQGKESINNVGQILSPADLKDVLKKYEDVKHASQLKPTRHVRNNKHLENSSSRNINLSLDQETDLLSQINEEFFRNLDSPEWTERRDALVKLRKTIESSSRLRPGNYEPLLTALKKVIIEDQCVIVVGLAIASVTGIAQGLQQQFSTYAIGICRILLEKFVEKRQNITEQLRKALDVLITTTSFESLIKTINAFLGSKNPTIRFETIQLLSRMFKNTNKQTLRKSEFSVLYKSLANCLHHGQLIIREKSFIALAIAFKIAGEGVIMPYLDKVDHATRTRIKNYNLDHDFEETYNEVKYRNVAKKDLKNEDKSKEIKFSNVSSDSNWKDSEKLDKSINESVSSYFKSESQKKRIKPMRKRENQPSFSYNSVTKRWNSTNSNITMEEFYSKSESKKSTEKTFDGTISYKDVSRKKENLKRYPYRKPYTVQRKETHHVLSKDKRKKKKIFSYKKKYTPKKILNDFVEHNGQIGDNIIVNVAQLSNNEIKLQKEDSHNINKDSSNFSNQTVKCINMSLNSLIKPEEVTESNNEIRKMENLTSSALIRENSELNQPMKQSVQTLDSKCGEGFIVLTESEVKKLLGLKRVSAISDDSRNALPDWGSKKNLIKRSYKIFQVSKDATDKETQTSLSAAESNFEISPESGTMDLIKTVDVIPTQTACVSIVEKGTEPQRIKRYNRGTQWVQHLQTEILDTVAWSKQEASSDWKGLEQQKVHHSHLKEKEAPLKMQSVVMKKIEYRRPSVKDIRRQFREDHVASIADHASKRTMEINTFTVTRSDPIHISKNTSSLTSELNGNTQERNNTKHHKEQNQKHARKDKKRPKQLHPKTHNSEDKISKNSSDSRQIKKIKRKYMHEIMVRSNKETTESRQNNISSHTLIKLKKIESTKHHPQSEDKDVSTSQVLIGRTSRRSDVSIRRSQQKGRRSLFTQSSRFKYENCYDTSSGSCREGCNFLPFVTKSIMGRPVEQNEKKKNNARRKQNKHRPHRNARRTNRSNHTITDQKRSEYALNRRNSRKDHQLDMMDAQDMDPETKQMVINELLKVCDISQATFQKMVRHKASPRPSLLSPKAVLQRVNELSSSADQDTSEDRSAREHKACTIL